MITKITKSKLEKFRTELYENEKSANTISKYMRDLRVFTEFVGNRKLTKTLVVEYKQKLIEQHKPTSVNSMLAAVNSFLEFIGRADCRVKQLKIQRSPFADASRELTKDEYRRMLKAARNNGDELTLLIFQTIASTGIRVSELQFITVKAVNEGKAYIQCKGKFRVVFLPRKLRKLLRKYVKKQKITAGAVFVTKNNKPLCRSNIWKKMKDAAKLAKVSANKVFPHNLRHLFARTYYAVDRDIFRLADILGHSSVNTTRIYTSESGELLQRRLNALGLLL